MCGSSETPAAELVTGAVYLILMMKGVNEDNIIVEFSFFGLVDTLLKGH